LHFQQLAGGAPRQRFVLLVGVELVHREHQVLATEARHLRLTTHHDRVGRTDLHTQLTEDARLQIEREVIGIAALFAGHFRFPLRRLLDRDHLRRTDPLAGQTADARLVPRFID
jgi:hypothetical protein